MWFIAQGLAFNSAADIISESTTVYVYAVVFLCATAALSLTSLE